MDDTVRVHSSPLRVAICGGGASAVLLLEALARTSGRRIAVDLIEPRAQLARGVAYSTPSPLHLLNAPVGRMAAGDDSPSFLHWLQSVPTSGSRRWSAEDFAPRALYGQYLEWLLERVRARPHIDLTWHRTAALQLTRAAGGWRIELACGPALRADAVVLATGPASSAPLGEHLAEAERARVVEDPWDAQAKRRIPRDGAVLLAGCGLTAVDVAMELLYERRHRGPVIVFSRRGLWPRSHGARTPCDPSLIERVGRAGTPRELVSLARELAAQDASGSAWRGLVDEFRRTAAAIWGRLDAAQRRQFMRHLRPFWEAHRHRMAPAIAARLVSAVDNGRLTLLRGRLESMQADRTSHQLAVTLRVGGGTRILQVASLINCTGPTLGLEHSTNPLVRSLVLGGLAHPDPLGLGIVTAPGSRVVAAGGTPHPTLFALGALTRGSCYELTAIPEIAAQARVVAQEILMSQAERAASSGSSPSGSVAAGRLGSVTTAVSPTRAVRGASESRAARSSSCRMRGGSGPRCSASARCSTSRSAIV
jgi:uncharacterized NAD(P)/FAD-binding protein YdhS